MKEIRPASRRSWAYDGPIAANGPLSSEGEVAVYSKWQSPRADLLEV
jgi:hypothetical protein